MWYLLLIPGLMVLHDYMKMSIDTLYFTKFARPVLGIKNTFRDLMYYSSRYQVKDFPGLLLIRMHFNKIREEFNAIAPTLKKRYYHDLDPWFDKNDNYYFYRVDNFPLLWNLIKQIRCINTSVAAFAVIDGPMVIPPHRAESNKLLRYQLTVEGTGDCTLYTEYGRYTQKVGEEFLFDHARYHELVKTGNGRRVLLILDVERC